MARSTTNVPTVVGSDAHMLAYLVLVYLTYNYNPQISKSRFQNIVGTHVLPTNLPKAYKLKITFGLQPHETAL